MEVALPERNQKVDCPVKRGQVLRAAIAVSQEVLSMIRAMDGVIDVASRAEKKKASLSPANLARMCRMA